MLKEDLIRELERDNLKYKQILLNIIQRIVESTYEQNLKKAIAISDKKTRDFEEFKDKIKNFRHFIESLLIKTNTITQHFKVLEAEKNVIQNERLELIKRASVGFDNLTPRPNIE